MYLDPSTVLQYTGHTPIQTSLHFYLHMHHPYSNYTIPTLVIVGTHFYFYVVPTRQSRISIWYSMCSTNHFPCPVLYSQYQHREWKTTMVSGLKTQKANIKSQTEKCQPQPQVRAVCTTTVCRAPLVCEPGSGPGGSEGRHNWHWHWSWPRPQT
jgi:hypothetical protein